MLKLSQRCIAPWCVRISRRNTGFVGRKFCGGCLGPGCRVQEIAILQSTARLLRSFWVQRMVPAKVEGVRPSETGESMKKATLYLLPGVSALPLQRPEMYSHMSNQHLAVQRVATRRSGWSGWVHGSRYIVSELSPWVRYYLGETPMYPHICFEKYFL